MRSQSQSEIAAPGGVQKKQAKNVDKCRWHVT